MTVKVTEDCFMFCFQLTIIPARQVKRLSSRSKVLLKYVLTSLKPHHNMASLQTILY